MYIEYEQLFYHSLKETIRLGGDTDTNACIVAGLIGSAVGVKNIPKDMINKLLSFDCTTQGRLRPEFLSVKKHLLKNISKMITKVPNEIYQLEIFQQ
jgi:ADP-ribosylglycohydrolase